METSPADEIPVIGKLPDNWVIVDFESLLIGGTRNGIYKPKEFHGSGAKIVNMGELFAHPRLYDVPMRRVQLSPDEMNKFILEAWDLLFARRSLVAEGAGKCSIVLEVNEPTTFESSIIRARVDNEIASSLYLYYLFLSPYGVHLMTSITRQVAVAGITSRDLARLPIPLPPLSEQQAIAGILDALDDKIELNRRENETLEAIAQALFKSWFVDFDPVRAKAAGQQPEGMDAATAALFPDGFEESELGGIPRGWAVKPFSDSITLLGGGTPSTSEATYWNGDIPWYSVVDAPADSDVFVIDTEKKITEAGLANSSTRMLPTGTTIISARGTVGKCALVGQPMAMNQSCYGVNGSDGRGDYHTYFSLRALVSDLQRNSHGSVFATITRATFDGLKVAQPPIELTAAFDRAVRPFMDNILSHLYESRTLATIRDTLLPKLLSGEVRVR